MHETLILLMPLLAGYWFTQSFALTQILSQRYDGYHRLWFTAGFAVPFACFGRLVTTLLAASPAGRGLQQLWFVLFPPEHFPYSGTAAVSVLAGAAASSLLLAWRSTGRHRGPHPRGLLTRVVAAMADPFEGYAWAARTLDDHLVGLLIETTRRKQFVLITLDNGKVYLGAVIRFPALYPEHAHIGILPAYSGFRGSDSRIQWTVNYTPVWNGRSNTIELADLLVVVPTSRIRTAQTYDPEISSLGATGPTL
jgi:hypothetical protein